MTHLLRHKSNTKQEIGFVHMRIAEGLNSNLQLLGASFLCFGLGWCWYASVVFSCHQPSNQFLDRLP